MKKCPYKIFDKTILRTPTFSISDYFLTLSKIELSEETFKELMQDPFFKEAIFLASPSFLREIEKLLKSPCSFSDKKKEQIQYSLLKYFSRISSRCTPFGLFAGISIGRFGKETKIVTRQKDIKRRTRLDMDYLDALSKDLAKKSTIKNQILFYPNSSIYKLGKEVRFVEYYYNNGKRNHDIVSVEFSDYINKVLTVSKNGATISTISNSLLEFDDDIKNCIEFVDNLIEAQLLVSELEPSVSGLEFEEQLQKKLEKIHNIEFIQKKFNEIIKDLRLLDSKMPNTPDSYTKISKKVEQLGVPIDLKHLFQVDSYIETESNTLSQKIKSDILDSLILLNKLALPNPKSVLDTFKDEFIKKYEEKEVPLLQVLDIDTGIGYGKSNNHGDINPLVDDLVTNNINNKNYIEIKWSHVNSKLRDLLIECYINNDYCISLDNFDVSDLESEWDDLPNTISAIVEVINIDGKEMVKFGGVGGSSAANLLGRFCYLHNDVLEFTKEIVEKEKELNKNEIIAEIVHLPEARAGNVLMRPDFREYEIPYLSSSGKSASNKITPEDIMISVEKNELKLKSKKSGNQIKTRLSNAHNFPNSSLPVYHFLGDFQTQGMRNGIGFNFGPFSDDYIFIPRVTYKSTILHYATWNLTFRHLNELKKDTSSFRRKYKIPEHVVLSDGDNKILICFNNGKSRQMFFRITKNKSKVKISEFLFNERTMVHSNANKKYTNEFIISFYK
ncbi:lantibiotic dehydratase family protein [Flagellimonas onchidii]|uniref:lantibiotic dehydratase family protein n=1 Tax=Flagellimonas onchidii TaxID=2562684 RepID=UPI0010A66ADD|nr:lantibiotic dehydratase family protein [Allomuricauda onchidii]